MDIPKSFDCGFTSKYVTLVPEVVKEEGLQKKVPDVAAKAMEDKRILEVEHHHEGGFHHGPHGGHHHHHYHQRRVCCCNLL